MKKLLLRPAPVYGESWPGYLLRLAETNGYAGIKPLASGLDLRVRHVLYGDCSGILKRLGVTLRDLSPHSSIRHKRPGRGPAAVGRSCYSKFCPHCLAQDKQPYFRARWDLPLELTCQAHGCMLVSACGSCGKTFRADRRRLLFCDCGSRLSSTKAKPLDPVWLSIQALLSVDRPSLDEELTFAAATTHEMLALRVLQRLANQSRAGSEAGSGQRKRTLTQAWLDTLDMNAAQRWFVNWPSSFEEKFSAAFWDPKRETNRHKYLSVRIDWAPFPLLKDKVSELIRRRQCSPRPKNLQSATEILRQETVSLRQLMKLSGIHSKVLLAWMAKGMLPGVKVTTDCGSRSYAIPSAAAAEALAFLERTIAIRPMAQEIGLSTSALNSLTTSGALKSVRLQDSTYTARVDASEVYALVGKILNAAKRSNRTHQDLVSLDQAIVKSRKKSQIAPFKLVSALLTKSLQLWVTDPEDMSLASAALPKEQFISWRRGLRG